MSDYTGEHFSVDEKAITKSILKDWNYRHRGYDNYRIYVGSKNLSSTRFTIIVAGNLIVSTHPHAVSVAVKVMNHAQHLDGLAIEFVEDSCEANGKRFISGIAIVRVRSLTDTDLSPAVVAELDRISLLRREAENTMKEAILISGLTGYEAEWQYRKLYQVRDIRNMTLPVTTRQYHLYYRAGKDRCKIACYGSPEAIEKRMMK